MQATRASSSMYRKYYKRRAYKSKYGKKRATASKLAIANVQNTNTAIYSPLSTGYAKLGGSNFPRRLDMKLEFPFWGATGSVTGGDTFQFQFKINALYRPATNYGFNVAMYRQLREIYNSYTVNACAWELEVLQSSTPSVQVVVVPTDQVFIPTTTMESYRNLPGAKLLTTGTPQSVVKFSGYTTIKSIMGRTGTLMNYELASGSFSLDQGPVDLGFLVVAVRATDESSTITAVLNAKLTYYVTLHEPQAVPRDNYTAA